ncbi:XAP5 protein [Ramicandelaber brevisporus]|nr:XAP5 protein [Ramicandelaber brevisporus]
MDPSVDTSGVPDRDKSNLEKSLRQQLESEWHSKQAAIKQQPISIVYSYWDGAGHRRKLACKKGDTIAHFLSLVKLQFPRELAKCRTVDELVFVKEDLILPHNITFYDLIVNKARGKSGPLFDFSAKDDVRIEMDGRKEKEDTHAAKVCERRWYERHKHTFPASRWEQFDPQRDYGSYSTK